MSHCSASVDAWCTAHCVARAGSTAHTDLVARQPGDAPFLGHRRGAAFSCFQPAVLRELHGVTSMTAAAARAVCPTRAADLLAAELEQCFSNRSLTFHWEHTGERRREQEHRAAHAAEKRAAVIAALDMTLAQRQAAAREQVQPGSTVGSGSDEPEAWLHARRTLDEQIEAARCIAHGMGNWSDPHTNELSLFQDL